MKETKQIIEQYLRKKNKHKNKNKTRSTMIRHLLLSCDINAFNDLDENLKETCSELVWVLYDYMLFYGFSITYVLICKNFIVVFAWGGASCSYFIYCWVVESPTISVGGNAIQSNALL